jgi:mRNA interferase MazF
VELLGGRLIRIRFFRRRPGLVVSEDVFNRGPAGFAIVLPVTSTLRDIPAHVRVPSGEGGLSVESAVLCDAIRSVSREHLVRRLGTVSARTLERVEDALRILLRL